MARFTRTTPVPFVTKTYSKFRLYIRADFEQCCAYCYFHEFNAHGEKNFQIDHYRPKDKFPELICDFHNLYWACAVCNGIKSKSNQWPKPELLAKGICFVDLCRDTWEEHYHLHADGVLEGLTLSAKYTIEAIDLNSEYFVKKRASLLKEGKRLDTEPD